MLFAGLTGVFSQVAPDEPAPLPVAAATIRPTPAAAPAAPASAATVATLTPAPDAPVAASSTPVRLQFPNSDVADVLHLYEQLTGKKLVMDNFVRGR